MGIPPAPEGRPAYEPGVHTPGIGRMELAAYPPPPRYDPGPGDGASEINSLRHSDRAPRYEPRKLGGSVADVPAMERLKSTIHRVSPPPPPGYEPRADMRVAPPGLYLSIYGLWEPALAGFFGLSWGIHPPAARLAGMPQFPLTKHTSTAPFPPAPASSAC